MTRLRTVTLLLVAGLFLALAGPAVAASATDTSAPSVQTPSLVDSGDDRHCC